MFPEFGQAPLSLDIDLDSYEGSWTHVAAFRGGSGWLHVARATIQSEHDMLRADLIAACDHQGSAIPSWRAMHLTECVWSRLEPCFDEPPAILDDLLCEEEGSFYARWQRETNAELALLFDRAQRRIEVLEANATARTRAVERQISDLRRRRRMPECSIEARIALGAVIADLESESDAAAASLADQRTMLRRQADAAEEALWQRTDLLIEIEPRITVRWRAASNKQERRPSRIWRQGEYYTSAAPYEGVEDREKPEEVLTRFAAALQANAEKADAERAARETQKVSHARAPALPKHSPRLA
ncbi:hypothetical protein KRR38_31370 [Novosphingobium sp. G106]|uniref:hypothetical protein n=1 Tax=Novosphingobium sp. G106 TaxID=2849500 RepID=UPI001C2D922A|nr:hypothetical protein [Novosphingobium sp. G106]MBV1692049.1 hypothetical protein [Novosphingobium sp. G106]